MCVCKEYYELTPRIFKSKGNIVLFWTEHYCIVICHCSFYVCASVFRKYLNTFLIVSRVHKNALDFVMT